MLSLSTILATYGLLVTFVAGWLHDGRDLRSPRQNEIAAACTENVTLTDTTTVFSSTTVPITHHVNSTVLHYVNVTVICTETETETSHVVHWVTESSTCTVSDTVSVTETDLATVTNTETATATIPATITTYTTETIFSTTFDPCPTTCSVSAGTVSLFFWPTDRPYTYPSTYIDTALDYTFTSPSVYMLIPTIVGTNSLGTTGPATADWIIDLDLEEVSTIVDGSITQQLTLSHLGTDCPQSADPSAIATMVDSRCAPILAAPEQVTSWAYPCNACGQFGLFDPPYAVPTITGGLLVTTTVTPSPETSDEVTPTSEAASSVVSTAEDTFTGGGSETETSPVEISPTVSSSVETTSPADTTTSDLPTTPPPEESGSAIRVMGGGPWLVLTAITAVLLT